MPLFTGSSKESSNNWAPYFSFKDLDENKPSGSIRIRVETIDYFLRRYREDIVKRRNAESNIETQLAAFERSLRDHHEMAVAGY
jgi:predicted nucleotide-binding protein (sugar kinase/HSP70/actin superfamily)